MFFINVTIKNDGSLDQQLFTKVDLVEKPSIIPELEQIDLASGFVSERYELGKTPQSVVKSTTSKRVEIPCVLRENHLQEDAFNIEVQVYTIIEGKQYLADTSTLQGILV